MSDLTPLFSQCVSIVSKELPHEVKRDSNVLPRPFLASDSFSLECSEVYANLVKLATFISEVRPLYLQINDEFSRLNHGQSRELSAADKQGLDQEFLLKVQAVYEKLKHLQEYERKRVQICEAQGGKQGFILAVFSVPEDDPLVLYNQTLATHRMHILRFLSESTLGVNSAFEQMQKQRQTRERLLNLLHIQNLDDTDDMDLPMDDFNGSAQYQFDVSDDGNNGGYNNTQLTQEQIQELLLENQELLNLKTNQFKLVEKLHHSMVDIVKLQTELTMHLETQAEQIDTLLDNQDQIDIDLRMGNRNLAKATDRNKRGSNLIVTTCVVLGFLLLFVDYIS